MDDNKINNNIENEISLSEALPSIDIKDSLDGPIPIFSGTISVDLSHSPCYEITSLSEANKVIKQLYDEGDFNGALRAIGIAIRFAKQNRANPDKDELKKLYLNWGHISGELNNFRNAMKYYSAYHYLSMQLNTNLFEDKEPQDSITLFQFRRFSDYALANLMKSEITLSQPSEMNDIVDTFILTWLNSPTFGQLSKYKGHLDGYKKSFRDYRIASFCEDNPSNGRYAVRNTLMWAHYASDHRGFCIEYSFDKSEFRRDDLENNTASRIFRIEYVNPEKEMIIFENAGNSINTKTGFIKKSNDWEYENEIRLIQYKPLNGAVREQYQLNPKSKIVAIYFGCRCSKDNIRILKKLLSGRNIKFYQMEIDYSNVLRLKFHAI